MFEQVRPVKKARLNIAPLLDMIFILLIFFVVSTSFSKLPGILINRPDGSVTDQLPPNNLLVGIDTKGRFFTNKKEYAKKTLGLLRDIYSAKPIYYYSQICKILESV